MGYAIRYPLWNPGTENWYSLKTKQNKNLENLNRVWALVNNNAAIWIKLYIKGDRGNGYLMHGNFVFSVNLDLF